MKKIIAFLFILFSVFVLSQNIKSIRMNVAEINRAKDYKVKLIPNSYFINKNQVTDNGIELKGYYKDGKLKKMEHSVGLSAWTIVTQYFFSENGKLIFVLTKNYQIVDKDGYMKSPKFLSESRYYYINEKLIKVIGISERPDLGDSYLEDSKTLRKDLEEYK